MIVIKIDESKIIEDTDLPLPVSMPESCFKCPFYFSQLVDEGCRELSWCGFRPWLGYSETNVFNNNIIDGDGNLVDDIIRPKDKCPLISITKEGA